MSGSLEEERKKIDDIDRQLLSLFIRRMGVSEEISKIKQEQGLPVYFPHRENEIIQNMVERAPSEFSGYITSFYHSIFELSRNRQRSFRQGAVGPSPFERTLELAAREVEKPHVIVQGVAGAYSASAANKIYPGCSLSFVPQWEDVLYGVEAGAADYGVLPMENTAAGSIFEVYDLMLKHRLFVVCAYALKVDHCLLGVRGAKLIDVRDVYSNQNAFPQCTGFFEKNHRLHKHPYLNTAMAAKYVAREGDPSKAAIASRENAHLYGLDILAESIQQNPNTRTRFISVAKRPIFSDDANKISVTFTLPHVTGSLCRTLTRFANAGLNLTKIESRPKTGENFEYFFCLDFTGSIRSEQTKNLLSALSEELPDFYFFGNYKES